MIFYEGGHHLTAHPFGELPSYENALNAIHRDSAIYNLYNEWFQKLRSLQNGNEPLLCMNFLLFMGSMLNMVHGVYWNQSTKILQLFLLQSTMQ